jgi:hypothetical protein
VASSVLTSVVNGERTGSWGTRPRPWGADAGAELSVEEATLPGAKQSATKGLDGLEPSDDKVTVLEVPPVGPLRRLRDDQVLQIAEGIRAETGASYQGDPRGLAYRLGIDVVPGFPEAGEKSTATEAVFSWHRDRRERGIRIYCALVRSFFLARRIAYGPGDVWALTIELVLPTHERWIGRLTLIFTQRFCPESVICAYVPDT